MPNGRRVMACSTPRAPRWSTPRSSCARKTWCRCPTNRWRSSRCRRSSRAWRWRIAIRPDRSKPDQKTFYAVSPIPAAWTHAQTDSFLREYNSRSIRNLTIHEAMPGHYLQLAHANNYPSTLRAVLSSGPFIEGWAVYTERADERAGLPRRRSADEADAAQVVPAHPSSTRCSTRRCTSTASRARPP